MRIKNYIFLGLFFLIVGIISAQERKAFYIKIPNQSDIPIVTHSSSGVRIAYSNHANSALNTLINSYEIYRYEKAFKHSNRVELQSIYLIECNDIELMNDLIEDFSSLYPEASEITGSTLVIPNDYGSTGGYLGDQVELDYIRAPETWDTTTGSSDIKIGIADTNFTTDHEDLDGTVEVVGGLNLLNANQHGSRVASYAAGNTNNGLGMSSIGHDSYIYGTSSGGIAIPHISLLTELSSYPEVKVLNASWRFRTSSNGGLPIVIPDYMEIGISEIVDNGNQVIVAAAGNGYENNGDYIPTNYNWPASYEGVIAVSGIGHDNKTFGNFETFVDSHEYLNNSQVRTFQHNDSIDIVAPSYGTVHASPSGGGGLSNYSGTGLGTSYAAPMVSGTVALMFDVNYCIAPKEVETILKLTAVKIDHLPQNLPYYGKLGAGKLDAYEAVKMAKDMADTFGTVEVKDRILYRPWFYKLETAPYEIKMTNNDVTGGSKIKFKARNNIEILSGDYHPDTGGYIDLSIDATLALDCPPPPSSSKKSKTKVNNIEGNTLESSEGGLLVFPNPTRGIINIINNEDLKEISITDITGKVFYNINNVNTKEISLDISKLNSGVYFLKTKIKTGEISIKKIIKK